MLAIATSLTRMGDARSRIPAMCERLSQRERGADKALRAVITGHPTWEVLADQHPAGGARWPR
ncbi:MAG: hypothetical protein IPN17_30500 [Deltaproteobacteria bacterium]|nr:hypothetical protein [Deltaproteobacteria bacterium]